MSNKSKGAGVQQILNVQLETFERAVYHRRHNEAGQLLLTLIDRLRTGADFIGFTTDDPLKTKLYSRLAAAIVAMLGDPGFQFSSQGWAMFATNHPVLQAIFESSVFDTAEHLVPALVSNPEEKNARKFKFDDSRAMAKYLLTYCLNGTTDMNFEELFSKTAKTTLPLWLGMLAHHVCLHPSSHERRERLVDTGEYFDGLALPDGLLPALSDSYMYSSYLTREDKHRLKDSFGRLLRNMLGKLIQVPSELTLKETRLHAGLDLDAIDNHGFKPTILIPLEWFNSLHAMYRCYADAVSQLRPHFRLVASCKEETLDEKARELFDDFLWLPKENVAIDALVTRINDLAPDIIFYPSVGMALWWVACAQLRLAPIQVMSLGHPASSRSPEIDYVLADRGMIPNTAYFTERVLELPPNAFRFIGRTDTVVPPRHERQPDDPVRIAVPSMVVKITTPFMHLCKRAVERSGRTVEFHFFPNVLGIWRFQAKRQLERWLPGCVVHHRYDYPTFLSVLSKCDLMLSTFPFGGTNSLVDAMLCGVPIVAMERTDGHPHEVCDAWALRRVGLDDLVADTLEMYEDVAVDLIVRDDERLRFREKLLAQDVNAIFHGPLSAEAEGAVLRAFKYVYAHHEEIQATDERVVPWEIQ